MDKEPNNIEKKEEKDQKDDEKIKDNENPEPKKTELKEAEEFFNDNIVRKTGYYIYNALNLDTLKIKYYSIVHDIYIFILLFIILFTTNIFYLIVLLVMITLDAFSIIVLHKCPLTLLEEKYLGKSSSDVRNELLQKLGVCYKCNHIYEMQIELIINVWLIIAFKCLCLMFIRMFHINISNM